MENILLGLIILVIILLTACGLLWYRGFIFRKKLRYWRNLAVKVNGEMITGNTGKSTTVKAPWLRK